MRAISTESANKLCGLCLLVSGDKCVLCGLRSGKLERLVLCGESSNLILCQEVKDSTGVVLSTLNDVKGVSLVSILYISDCRTGVTATFSYLARKSVETCLGVISKSAYGIIYTIKALKNCGVYTIEALAKCLLNTCLTEFEVIKVVKNGRVVEACGEVSLRSTRRAIATTKATAKAVAVVTPTEKKENDDPIMLS